MQNISAMWYYALEMSMIEVHFFIRANTYIILIRINVFVHYPIPIYISVQIYLLSQSFAYNLWLSLNHVIAFYTSNFYFFFISIIFYIYDIFAYIYLSFFNIANWGDRLNIENKISLNWNQ